MSRWLENGLVALVVVLLVAQLFLPDRGVGFVTGLVVLLLIWWMVLFAVLPRRVRGQFEDGDVVPGTEPGAPVEPRLKEKAWLTTLIACGLWLVYFVVFEFELIGLDAIPFGLHFEPPE